MYRVISTKDTTCIKIDQRIDLNKALCKTWTKVNQPIYRIDTSPLTDYLLLDLIRYMTIPQYTKTAAWWSVYNAHSCKLKG